MEEHVAKKAAKWLGDKILILINIQSCSARFVWSARRKKSKSPDRICCAAVKNWKLWHTGTRAKSAPISLASRKDTAASLLDRKVARCICEKGTDGEANQRAFYCEKRLYFKPPQQPGMGASPVFQHRRWMRQNRNERINGNKESPMRTQKCGLNGAPKNLRRHVPS